MRKTNFLILIIAIVLSACLIGCDGCNGCGGGQDPVNIEEENITIKRIGDTVQLTVTGGNDEKVWSSTDTAVATVTDAGLVTAVANGIAEITVTSAETTDVCVIVVRETVIPEPGLIVTFPKTAVTLNAFMSETYTIVPTITKNNVAVEGATITWTTSDETKATIVNGLVTAIANTEAGVPVVITCRAELGGEFAEAKLKVLESYGDDYLPYLESWYKCAPINGEVSTEVDGETIKVTIFEIQQILCNHYLDAVSYLHFFTNHPDMIEFLKMGFFNCK